MPGIRSEADLEERLEAIAAKTGRSKSYYVRETIRELIEDWEEAAEAITTLEHPGRRWTLDESGRGRDMKADGPDH